MSTSTLTDEYMLGVEYEVVNDLISFEAAYHNSQRYDAGKDTALGVLHHESMQALERLRTTIRVDDANSIAAAKVALDAMRADRLHLEAL